MQKILLGDCRKLIPSLEEKVDAVVTDPPYGLEFMGKEWDRGVPGVEFWKIILGSMKPGAHMLVFGGTKTHHRLMCAIEDAGFEIRDCLMWVYGTGFPKSRDISKDLDKGKRKVVGLRKAPGFAKANVDQGAQDRTHLDFKEYSTDPVTEEAKKWYGWGTALKPAWEPIVLARKPLGEKTVAENVLKYGVGALNIEACKVGNQRWQRWRVKVKKSYKRRAYGRFTKEGKPRESVGRWPANLIHDGSDEVLKLFPHTGNEESAARLFYCAKVSKKERGEGNDHPTVKPIKLLRYLCRLVTPPRGIILDPFAGSGSTLLAAAEEGFDCIGIEIEDKYYQIARRRIRTLTGEVE